MSLAGVQDKLAVCLEGETVGLAKGGRPTTHILKPFIQALDCSVVPSQAREPTRPKRYNYDSRPPESRRLNINAGPWSARGSAARLRPRPALLA